MFTGLVQDLGTVVELRPAGEGARLVVEAPLAGELADGDSVSVSGVCLTATRSGGGRFEADVVAETLRRTSLASLRPGARVNLEPALRASDRLGGHVVQGHVDGTGKVESIAPEGLSRLVTITAAPSLLRHVVEKGSIAVDGVSLTVAGDGGGRFSVALIPETLERTTLGAVREGTTVNVEVDVLAKYVDKLLSRTVESR